LDLKRDTALSEWPKDTIYDPQIHVIGRIEQNQYDPVLLGIVRRTWPTLLANSIIGSQNMMNPSGQVFSLRSKYSGATSNTQTVIIKDEIDGE
jgi:hypothetical protein